MRKQHLIRTAGRGLVTGLALASAGYAALVIRSRVRYGGAQTATPQCRDSLLDRFIPEPEVLEHHQIAINAPPDVVMTAAKELELLNSPIVSTVIRLRELALGSKPDTRPHPPQLMAQMQSIGWGVLAERAAGEIVFGAVTQPWQAAPVFRAVPAAAFRDFAEPGFVKIAWTLRVDPLGGGRTMFHTETRVATTDAPTRRRFRRYWSFVAPGVQLIRLAMLWPLKRAAEKRQRVPAS